MSDFRYKIIRKRIETILHIVLKFKVDHACFHGAEARANFDRKSGTRKKTERI